ncbi:MAG: YggS family pyridoxal phosphate-dependent enzyme [Burkholderiales bacterium]
MSALYHNFVALRERVARAAKEAGRNTEDICILAVSKTWPPEVVREVADLGQRAFGENQVQEAIPKLESLSDMLLEWHFIGPIQSNKTRAIAENFSWAHSVEREKIAQRLNDSHPDALAPLNVCLQVNISKEPQKSGVTPADARKLAEFVSGLPRLKLRGLMAIPEQTADVEASRAQFRELRELRDELNERGLDMDTLSMGMSHDLEAAILEGATIVRVGTAIFGERAK